MTAFEIPSNHAVKAIVYRADGCLLMQQRDDMPGLPFGACWDFWGGLAEPGETCHDALVRELTEELGGIPGEAGPELFVWEWQSDWMSTCNHFFPVRADRGARALAQHEGQAMAWLPLEALVELPLAPAVYENFARVAEFLAPFAPDLIGRIEGRLLAFNALRKKNDRVFYAAANPCAISTQQIVLLKELASLRRTPVFRVCLHTDDRCDVHEMLMIHTAPISMGPLKQNKTSLSYHVLHGSLTVCTHDDAGAVVREFRLGEGRPAERRAVSLRLKANEFRSVHSTSPFSIFLEVASGPFIDSDTLWLDPNSGSHTSS